MCVPRCGCDRVGPATDPRLPAFAAPERHYRAGRRCLRSGPERQGRAGDWARRWRDPRAGGSHRHAHPSASAPRPRRGATHAVCVADVRCRCRLADAHASLRRTVSISGPPQNCEMARMEILNIAQMVRSYIVCHWPRWTKLTTVPCPRAHLRSRPAQWVTARSAPRQWATRPR